MSDIIGPIPNTIVPGTLADAVPVMSNFNWIRDEVNANAIGGHNVDSYYLTSDLQAINDAIAAAVAGLNGSNTVYFEARDYVITAGINPIDLSGSKNIRLIGQRAATRPGFPNLASSGTRILCNFTTAGQIALNIYTTGANLSDPNHYAGFEISDLAIQYNGTGAGADAKGIQIGYPGTQISYNGMRNVIRNVFVDYFLNDCVSLLSCEGLLCNNLSVFTHASSVKRALFIYNNKWDCFSGDTSFDACDFHGTGNAGQNTVEINCHGDGTFAHSISIAGLHFTDCNFYDGNTGLSLFCDGTGLLLDCFFENCQWDGVNSIANIADAIYIACTTTSSTISGVQFTNCYMVNWHVSAIFAISFVGGYIENIGINNNYIGECLSSPINLSGVSGSNITGTRCFSSGSGTGQSLIVLDAGSSNNVVANNIHKILSGGSPPSGIQYLVTIGATGTNTYNVVTSNVGNASVGSVNNLGGVTNVVANNTFS